MNTFLNILGVNIPDVDEFDILYYMDFDLNSIFVRKEVEFSIREGHIFFG